MKTEIEPGCLCLVVAGWSAGESVTAIEPSSDIVPIGSDGVVRGENLWKTDKPLEVRSKDGEVRYVSVCPAHLLRRIDGYTDDDLVRDVVAQKNEEPDTVLRPGPDSAWRGAV